MLVLPSSQVHASVAANTAHYEAALQQLDAALQAPVERQYEIERCLYALLSKVDALKIEHGVELPLAAAEHMLIRTEEEVPLNNLMSNYMAGNISEDEVVKQINAHRIEFGADIEKTALTTRNNS